MERSKGLFVHFSPGGNPTGTLSLCQDSHGRAGWAVGKGAEMRLRGSTKGCIKDKKAVSENACGSERLGVGNLLI
jgi:hypothetical protein